MCAERKKKPSSQSFFSENNVITFRGNYYLKNVHMSYIIYRDLYCICPIFNPKMAVTVIRKGPFQLKVSVTPIYRV